MMDFLAAVGWCISFTFLKACINGYLVTPCAMKVAPDDFMIFSIYAEHLFIKIQVVTVPLVATSTVALWFIFVYEIAGPLFRCFAGVDRVRLSLPMMKKAPEVCKSELGDGWRWKVFFHPSIQKVCELAMKADRDPELQKREWIDRELYHCIRGVGYCWVSIMARAMHILLAWLVSWTFPVDRQIHGPFDIYAVEFLAASVLSLCLIHKYVLEKLKMKTEGRDQEANLSRLTDYIIRQHFWQFFTLNIISGYLFVALMVKPR